MILLGEIILISLNTGVIKPSGELVHQGHSGSMDSWFDTLFYRGFADLSRKELSRIMSYLI